MAAKLAIKISSLFRWDALMSSFFIHLLFLPLRWSYDFITPYKYVFYVNFLIIVIILFLICTKTFMFY